jgi:hypothetical protein
VTTEPTHPEQDPLAEDDEFSERIPDSGAAREPRIPDVAVFQLPPDVVQFPTPGEFTRDGFKRDVSPLIGQLLQPKWLSVVVPLLLLYLYISIRVAGTDWFYLGSPLIFQPFVPLLTIWLIWRRRQQVMRQYYELAFVFPDDSPRRRGKLWPLFIAIILLAMAAIVQLPQLSVVGFVLSVFSIVYYLFGFFQLRSLWQMLAFLLLMIPPPIGALARLTYVLQIGETMLSAMIARLFDSSAEVRDRVILHLATSNLMITPALCGITVIVPIFVLTVWLAMLRRVPVLTTVALVVIGCLIAIAANTVRILTFAILGLENLNPWLVELTTWTIVGLSFFLVRGIAARLTARRPTNTEEENEATPDDEDELTADLDVLLRESSSASASETASPKSATANDNR